MSVGYAIIVTNSTRKHEVYMIKTLVVFGTRPEAIKLAPVIKEFEKQGSAFKTVIAVTAQHREKLDQALSLFDIYPHYDMDIMKSRQDLFDITTLTLKGMQRIIKKENPDIVLVQGDTTTTFAAGLSAYYSKIPVGHVEAGLRTYDRYQPYPEEINRQLTSVIASYNFAPTEQAKVNLIHEGIPEGSITVTGNTGIDALFMTLKNPNPFRHHPVLKAINVNKRTIIVTAHRRENWGVPIDNICMAILKIIDKSDVNIVFSVHLNPIVRKTVHRILGQNDRVILVDPLDYANFVELMNKCYLILTDSGGIQEEAPSLGKPVLVLRNLTERPEAVEAGTAKVVGTDPGNIADETLKLLNNKAAYDKMARIKNPYGDGKAAPRIVKVIKDKLSKKGTAE